MSVPPACQKIAGELKALQDEQASLAADMQDAPTGQKSWITTQIKKLTPLITAKNNELKACITKNTIPPKANPCVALQKELQALLVALQREVRLAVAPLQEDLATAPPGQKPSIIKEIKQTAAEVKAKSPLTPKIQAKQKEHTACIVNGGGKLDLYATFTGTATLTTSDPDASGPFKQSVNIGLYFSIWDRHLVSVTSFPPISVSYDTGSPVGTVTTTVSLNGDATGTFDAAASSIKVTVPLLFHHSTIWAADSTLVITVTSSAPVGADGKVSVSGSATFKDGYLGGQTCWLTVEGTISPRP